MLQPSAIAAPITASTIATSSGTLSSDRHRATTAATPDATTLMIAASTANASVRVASPA